MKRIILLVVIVMLVSPLYSWSDEVRYSIIEDAINSLQPQMADLFDAQQNILLNKDIINKEELNFVSYNQAGYKLTMETKELLRSIPEEDEYFKELALITAQTVELFDPFIISRNRGIYTSQDNSFQNEVEDILNEIRTTYTATAYNAYSTPWLTPTLGNQTLTHSYNLQTAVPSIINVSQMRGKRVMALYLRGYNIYDLRGEIAALYGDAVRTTASTLSAYIQYYQVRNRMYNNYPGQRTIKVEIGDWYKDDGYIRGKKVYGLKGFGVITYEKEKNEDLESAVEGALRIALESENVRETLKKTYNITDRDINTSGIVTKLTVAPMRPYGYPYAAPYNYNQGIYGPSPYGNYGYDMPYQYNSYQQYNPYMMQQDNLYDPYMIYQGIQQGMYGYYGQTNPYYYPQEQPYGYGYYGTQGYMYNPYMQNPYYEK